MRKTLEQRFWEKVDKRGDDECWEWTGAKTRPNAYGYFRVSGSLAVAHRVSYELAYGGIPEDKQICHTCDNPACVNPSHLFVGTHTDNMQDKVAKGRNARGPKGA